MKFSGIFLALLAGGALVSAAPFRFCVLSLDDWARIEKIIFYRDDPAEIGKVLGDDGCKIKVNRKGHQLLGLMIEYDRPASFEFLYTHLDFLNTEVSMDMIGWGSAEHNISELLLKAYKSHNIAICDFLLSQNVKFDVSFWPMPETWTVKELKDLVSRHPENAHALCTSLAAYKKTVLNLHELLQKIGFNHHCATVMTDKPKSGLHSRSCHPTEMMEELIGSEYLGTDEDFAALFNLLLEMGAVVSEKMRIVFAARHPDLVQAERILFYAINGEIKEPDTEKYS